MRNTHTLLTFLVTVLVQGQTLAGIIEPHTVWDKNDITTCWYNQESQLQETSLKDENGAKEKYGFRPKELSRWEKRKVQETILRNFTPRNTGIHFTGWKDCSETRHPDLIVMEAKGRVPLFTRPSFNGRAVIGEEGQFGSTAHGHGFFSKSGKMAYVALYTQKAGTVVHEFGHVAGLRHEHILEESRRDENCHDRRVPLDFDDMEPLYDSAHQITTYDAYSIMNYCWLKTQATVLDRTEKVILSPKDRHTLKEYYP